MAPNCSVSRDRSHAGAWCEGDGAGAMRGVASAHRWGRPA
jgi:hypothetical protein